MKYIFERKFNLFDVAIVSGASTMVFHGYIVGAAIALIVGSLVSVILEMHYGN